MPSRSLKMRPVVGLLLALWGCEADVAETDDASVQGGGGGVALDAGPLGGDTGEGGQAAGGTTSAGGAGGVPTGGAPSGGAGGGEPPVCDAQSDPDACAAAGCYWWMSDARCHDAGPVNPCDQPDPATCAAAGCEWTDAGCAEALPPEGCEGLREVACSARPECLWAVDHCELDQSQLPCAQLPLGECALRGDCAWDDVASLCGPRPEGLCATLDPVACDLRADCQPEYAPAPECDCVPCDAADPACDPNACACPDVFLRCGQARADCAMTPAGSCDATPGCHLDADTGLCRADAPVDPCAGYPPDVCVLDARCRLEEFEVCDGGVPENCVLQAACVRTADPCAPTPIDACRVSDACHVEVGQICECGGAAAGAPADPVDPNAPGARIAPPPPAPEGCVCNLVELCLSNPPPPGVDCFAQAPDQCEAAGCALFVPDVACPPCDPNAGPCEPCEPPPPPACLDLGTYCGIQTPEACVADAHCAVQAVEVCESGPCMPDTGCPEPVCALVDQCVPSAAPPPPPGPPPAP